MSKKRVLSEMTGTPGQSEPDAKKQALSDAIVDKMVEKSAVPTQTGIFGSPIELAKYTASFQNKSLLRRVREHRRDLDRVNSLLASATRENEAHEQNAAEINRLWSQMIQDLNVLLKRIEPKIVTNSQDEAAEPGAFRKMLRASSQLIMREGSMTSSTGVKIEEQDKSTNADTSNTAANGADESQLTPQLVPVVDHLAQKALECNNLLLAVVNAVEQSEAKPERDSEATQSLVDDLHVQVRSERERADRLADQLAALTATHHDHQRTTVDLREALRVAEAQRDKAKQAMSTISGQGNASAGSNGATSTNSTATTATTTNNNSSTTNNAAQTTVKQEGQASDQVSAKELAAVQTALREQTSVAENRLAEIEKLRLRKEQLETSLAKSKLVRSIPDEDAVQQLPAMQQALERAKLLERSVAQRDADIAQLRTRFEELETAQSSALATLETACTERITNVEALLRASEQTVCRLRRERRAVSLKLALKETEPPSAGVVEEYRKQTEALKGEVGVLKGQLERLSAAKSDEQNKASTGNPLADEERVRFVAMEAELAARKASQEGASADEVLANIRRDFGERVTALEAQVATLQASLATAQETSAALMAEMEVIGQSFEESSEQNTRLLQQLREKDDGNLKLMSDKLKRAQEIRALKEHAVVQEQVRDKLTEKCAKQEAALKALRDEMKASNNAHRQRQSVVGELESARDAAEQATVEQNAKTSALKAQVTQAKAHAESIQTALDKRISVCNAVEAKLARVKEESSTAKRRLATARALSGEGGSGTDAITYYRQKLMCSVCSDREKNAVITKCFHVFCMECLQQNLRDRHRKCPGCGVRFGEMDVKRLYIGDE